MSVEIIEQIKAPTPDLLKGCPAGEVRGLVFYPDEKLQEVSEPVPGEDFGPALDKLVSDMVTTMYMTGGMGLSAIQVGVPLRVFVCDPHAGEPPRDGQPNLLLVAVNPTVTIPDDSPMATHTEGCLSFPGVSEVVERPDAIFLSATDRIGGRYTFPAAGVLSRIILHEMDHLDGTSFLDRMKPLAARSALQAVKRFHSGVSKGTVRVGGGKPKRGRFRPTRR